MKLTLRRVDIPRKRSFFVEVPRGSRAVGVIDGHLLMLVPHDKLTHERLAFTVIYLDEPFEPDTTFVGRLDDGYLLMKNKRFKVRVTH